MIIRAQNFGYNVACFLHVNCVAYANVKAVNKILVVQNCPRHGAARKLNRRKHGCRRNYAGASHRSFNVNKSGAFYLRRVFLKEKRKKSLSFPSFCTMINIQVVESGAKW